MAYTTAEIQEQKDLISALKKARLQAVETGGVKEFRQGTTHLVKASLQDITKEINSAENLLCRMEDVI